MIHIAFNGIKAKNDSLDEIPSSLTSDAGYGKNRQNFRRNTPPSKEQFQQYVIFNRDPKNQTDETGLRSNVGN